MSPNPNLEEIERLIEARTDVTDADLMRYEHGGGRWAKLRDGERVLVADFYSEADREYIVAAALSAPALIAALREAREALEPFARVAAAYDYWVPEVLPELRFPTGGDITLALQDCPDAVCELHPNDFRRARQALTGEAP